jgi:hypothetical protein
LVLLSQLFQRSVPYSIVDPLLAFLLVSFPKMPNPIFIMVVRDFVNILLPLNPLAGTAVVAHRVKFTSPLSPRFVPFVEALAKLARSVPTSLHSASDYVGGVPMGSDDDGVLFRVTDGILSVLEMEDVSGMLHTWTSLKLSVPGASNAVTLSPADLLLCEALTEFAVLADKVSLMIGSPGDSVVPKRSRDAVDADQDAEVTPAAAEAVIGTEPTAKRQCVRDADAGFRTPLKRKRVISNIQAVTPAAATKEAAPDAPLPPRKKQRVRVKEFLREQGAAATKAVFRRAAERLRARKNISFPLRALLQVAAR